MLRSFNMKNDKKNWFSENRLKIFLVVVLIFVLSITFLFYSNKKIMETIKDIFEKQNQENLLTQPTVPLYKTTTTTISKINESNQTQAGGGGSGGSAEPTITTTATIPAVLTLEIVDICSGKLESVFTVSEGVRRCANQKYPYYIEITKNSSNMTTKLLGDNGFIELFDINYSGPIYYLFVEDVASVSNIIESFSMEGSKDFYLGDHDLHTIWERSQTGNLYISKIIAILPLYIEKNATTSSQKELKIYLNIPNKTFYVGNFFALVNEK